MNAIEKFEHIGYMEWGMVQDSIIRFNNVHTNETIYICLLDYTVYKNRWYQGVTVSDSMIRIEFTFDEIIAVHMFISEWLKEIESK